MARLDDGVEAVSRFRFCCSLSWERFSGLGCATASADSLFSLGFVAAFFLEGPLSLVALLAVALVAFLVVALVGVFVVALGGAFGFFTTFFRAGACATSTGFGFAFLVRNTRSVTGMPLGGALAFVLVGALAGFFVVWAGLDSESFLDSLALASVDLVEVADFFSTDFGPSSELADLVFFNLLTS